MHRTLGLIGTLCGCLLAAARPAICADAATVGRLTAYEQEIASRGEDLFVAAEYRQLAIASGQFDRSIAFLAKVAKRPGSGANSHINLALALIDKIPSAGDIRRAYIGRDALSAITRAIELQPSVLAYFIRGRINLGYDKFMFRRTDKGVADLSRALALVTADTPPALTALVYVALGDGYYKLDDPGKAHDLWAAGAAKFPADRDLQDRLERTGVPLRDFVHDALSPGRRVDTSLAGLPRH